MKKGSALLVVLGMLAFMLISAVSFSAYMRYARLPSSFLRRSSASRLLAKAALAEAIDEIDAAIGNNPHPGVGTQQPRSGAGSLSADINGLQNENKQTRNIWQNRVYIGTNQLHEAKDTVSTLTLEGLAYIPPPLVNEARYYSRRSQAGIWKHLGFDSGRYAFCAIDVSDYFDVNALSAKIPRNSSPGGKISLAYLFEEGVNHASSEQDPKQWDKFLEDDAKVRQMSLAEAAVLDQNVPPANAQYVPFVSVADLNLAIHDQKPLGWESPFCKFIESGGSDFYSAAGVSDSTGSTADKVKRMSFVSDGWFPGDSASGTEADASEQYLDLSNFDNQPFETGDLEADNPSLAPFIKPPAREAALRLWEYCSGFGLLSLYDYLDNDNIPVSLAFPSTERIPMIAGIGSSPNMNNGKLQVKTTTKFTGDPTDDSYDGVVSGGQGTRKVQQITYYNLDGAAFVEFMNGGVFSAAVAYPYRRGPDVLGTGGNAFKYTLEGSLAVYFTRADDASGLRPGGTVLQLANSDVFTKVTLPENGACSVFRIPLKFSQLSNKTFADVTDENSAVGNYTSDIMDPSMRQQIGEYLERQENAVLVVVQEWDQTSSVDPGTNKKTWSPGLQAGQNIKSATSGLMPLVNGTAQSLGDLGADGTVELAVRSAIWLRLKNGNDKTVDLVPACVQDDQMFLGNNNASAGPILYDMLGKPFPILPSVGTTFVLGSDNLQALATTPLDCQLGINALCPDPRWNWAPEQWYRVGSDIFSDVKQAWLTAVHNLLGSEGRDNDIFLATSDAGYLQSVYELAMLPRWTDMTGSSANQICGNMHQLNVAWANLLESADTTPPTDLRNRHMMWQSYHPYALEGVSRDPFEDLRLVNQGGGFKVNPFTDDLNVMMAAFANTPFDWWAASTTTTENGNANGKMVYPSQAERLDAKTFNGKYAFNAMNPDAKFAWKDLQGEVSNGSTTKKGVATEFMRLVRERVNALGENATADTWKDVFDGVQYNDNGNGKMSVVETLNSSARMDWDGQASDFCGVNFTDTDELYDVDRKFLYGYWRECFAAKQQLFLVFVRAEPMMMGGGSAGQTPPQLGARAVALVWRDPTKSNDVQAPHRTRVLFYRQFD